MKLKDSILYADMQNSIALGADILYEDEHALLLRDSHSTICYCTADRKESAKNMVQHLPSNFGILVSHDELCNQVLLETCNLHYENRCYHCAYLEKNPLSITLPKELRIGEVSREYMEDVIRLYGKEMPALANEEYLGLCMDAGMYGVFDHKRLCGFISVHEGGYGSIGMLEVEEEYRHMGIATALQRHMINVQLSRGRIPYGEIFIENEASIQLQKRVGMQIGSQLTYWFYQ